MLQTIDTYIIFAYLMGVMGIGFYFAGKNKDPEEFMVAKRSLPGWLIGFSIFAGGISNITLIGATGKFFNGSLVSIIKYLAIPIGIYVAAKVFMPFHRKNRYVSAYTHLGKRFGNWAELYAVLSYILIEVIRMGIIMYLIAMTLSAVLGANVYAIITVTGLVVIAYSYSGGIEAVIWTDFVQGVLLIAGVLISVLYIIFSMPEGPMQVIDLAILHDKMSLGSMSFDFVGTTFWVLLLMGVGQYLQDFGVDQTVVQRYISSKSNQEAHKGLISNIWLMLPTIGLVALLGFCLFAFYTVNTDLSLTEGIFSMKADAVYPHFIATQLPVGVSGVLIAAILAAAMSSIDSSLNSVATMFHLNIYTKYINRHPGVRKSMQTLHVSSIVSGMLAIVLALSMTRIYSIWDTWYTVSTAIAGGVLGIFLLGLMAKRLSNNGALVSLILGLLVTGWAAFSQEIAWIPDHLKSPINDLLAGVLGTLTIVFIGITLSRFSKQNRVESS